MIKTFNFKHRTQRDTSFYINTDTIYHAAKKTTGKHGLLRYDDLKHSAKSQASAVGTDHLMLRVSDFGSRKFSLGLNITEITLYYYLKKDSNSENIALD